MDQLKYSGKNDAEGIDESNKNKGNGKTDVPGRNHPYASGSTLLPFPQGKDKRISNNCTKFSGVKGGIFNNIHFSELNNWTTLDNLSQAMDRIKFTM